MKTLVKEYTFDASAGTITLTGFTNIDPECLLMVINVTDNIIIFNFADPAKQATSIASNIITLEWDTTLMADTDALQVWVWNPGYITKLNVDSGDSTITYVGKAIPNSLTSAAVWQVKRLNQTGVDLDIEFADGEATFDKIYDNRESLTYG
jgi:hypothetical protein